MTTLNQMFPRKYATGEDLKGKAVTVVIKAVVCEKMRPNKDAKPEDKWVIYFEPPATKGVILSRTLAQQIAAAIGAALDDDVTTWKGKRVTLYPVPMQVAKQARVAIRARAATETNAHIDPPPAEMQDEDETDFDRDALDARHEA